MLTMLDPYAIKCPQCGAEPRDACVTRGRELSYAHWSRRWMASQRHDRKLPRSVSPRAWRRALRPSPSEPSHR